MAYLYNRQNMHSTIPQAENQYIEFKTEHVKAAELAEEMIAFANGEGGEIWLGDIKVFHYDGGEEFRVALPLPRREPRT